MGGKEAQGAGGRKKKPVTKGRVGAFRIKRRKKEHS